MLLTLVGVVAISAASRLVPGFRDQESTNESIKAFKAAETALEKALLQKGSLTVQDDSGISYKATYQPIEAQSFVTGSVIGKSEVIQVETASSDPSKPVRVYWSSGSLSAVKLADYWDDGVNSGVTYYNFDCDNVRATSNKFSLGEAGEVLSGISFSCKTPQLNLSQGSKMLRITNFYADSYIGINAQYDIPAQQVVVEALGVVGPNVQGGGVSRKISYSQSANKRLPYLFDHAIFTSSQLAQ